MKAKTLIRKILIAEVIILGLFSLFGCGKHVEAPVIPEQPVECGGKVDNSYAASTEIKSENIVSFRTHFYRDYADDRNTGSGSGSFYTFEVTEKDDGTLVLAETEALNTECTVPDTIFADIYEVIRRYDLFSLNGTDSYTAGLPPEYQPYSLTAEFDSGEKLYFLENGDPYDGWCAEFAEIFSKAFEAAGDTALRDAVLGQPFELGDAKIWHIEFNETGMAKSPWLFIEDMDDRYLCFMSDDEDALHPFNDFTAEPEEGLQLINSLIELGVLDWDGFSRSRSLEAGLLDADKSFTFIMYLDDGRSVRADGYNCFPENYSEVTQLLWDFFYSRIE